MVKTIQKISSYTSIATVVGAIVSTPAQAASLINTKSNTGIITSGLKANEQIKYDSTTNRSKGELNLNLGEKVNIKPQIVAENEFTPKNQVWSGLLQKPESTINALEQASKVTQLKIDESRIAYIYKSDQSHNHSNPDTTSTQHYTNIYSDIWKAPTHHPRKKVPEPSPLPGLIAIFCFFATQRQLLKKSSELRGNRE